MNEMSDQELAATVRAAQRGDAMAMAALVDELMPYVGRICGGIALEHGEDAAQNALIAVLRNLRRLEEPRALRGWVRTIATREAVRVAGRARVELPLEEPAVQAAGGGDPTLGVEIRDQLERLDPEQRAVLVLRDLEGMSEQEVAELLRLPEGTVKSRLHRARARFRKGWTE
jgi:DNA-directed RNA polymerase specialized sigma24 family protein